LEDDLGIDRRKGIIPRTVETIFEEIENRNKLEAMSNRAETLFSVQCSFLQLYNEQVEDLLTSKRKPLNIRENPQEGVFVEGLKKVSVSCKEELYSLVGKGFQRRVTASTALNDVSSRSHAIFRIVVEQMIQYKDIRGNISKQKSKLIKSTKRKKKGDA
jgi:kinesin family protein 3/17